MDSRCAAHALSVTVGSGINARRFNIEQASERITESGLRAVLTGHACSAKTAAVLAVDSCDLPMF